MTEIRSDLGNIVINFTEITRIIRRARELLCQQLWPRRRSDSWKQKSPARGERKPRISQQVRQSPPREPQGRRQRVCRRGQVRPTGPAPGAEPGHTPPQGPSPRGELTFRLQPTWHVRPPVPASGPALLSLSGLHRSSLRSHQRAPYLPWGPEPVPVPSPLCAGRDVEVPAQDRGRTRETGALGAAVAVPAGVTALRGNHSFLFPCSLWPGGHNTPAVALQRRFPGPF